MCFDCTRAWCSTCAEPALFLVVANGPAAYVADCARQQCQHEAEEGADNWRSIFLEEVAESFAEDDPAKLRAELVQVAAVAVAWIEAIDRRSAR